MHAFYNIILFISLTLIGISAEEIFSKDGPFTPTKGSVLANIEISDEMHFEMDIVVHSLPDSGTESILHCGTKNHSPSERFPAIFLYEPSHATGFNVRLTTSDTGCCGEGPTHSPDLNMEQSYHLEVEFTQSWLSVKVDGESTYFEHHGTHATGHQPCYAGNPWIDAADVTISNLRILSGLPTEGPQPTPATENRGVGIIPNACGSGKVMESGLCYNTCKSGYYGVACFCYNHDNWFDQYGRGCGTIPDQCPSSHPDLQAGLCYKSCPDSHSVGVGPVCWEHCEDVYGKGTHDTGAFCQTGEIKSSPTEKKFRTKRDVECRNGVIDLGFCYEPCPPGYDPVLGWCFQQNLDNSIAAILATGFELPWINGCYTLITTAAWAHLFAALAEGSDIPILEDLDYAPFLACAVPILETMAAIDDSWDADNGVTVAATASMTLKNPISGVNAYGGIAFEFEDKHNVNIYAFRGGCQQFSDPSFGAGVDGGMAIFRNVKAIDGTCTFSSAGVALFDIFGVSSSWSFDENCQISGLATTASVSSPGRRRLVNPTFGGGICATFDRTYLRTVPSPASKSSSAKSVQSNLLQRMNGNMENDIDMEMSQLNGV